MPKKTKFGFGSSSSVEQAVQDGKINARDVVFLDENTDNPKVGWVTLDGKVVVAKPDLSEIEAEVADFEAELATKAKAADVEALEGQIATKADAAEVETIKSEIAEKVDADTVQNMIEEHSSSIIEVIEF